MEHVLIPVIYFLVCLGVTYVGGWALVVTRGR